MNFEFGREEIFIESHDIHYRVGDPSEGLESTESSDEQGAIWPAWVECTRDG